MAEAKGTPPAVLLFPVFSRHLAAMQWAEGQISQRFGAVALRSELFDHSETNYYAEEMGQGLQKQFLVIQGLFDPADLASVKLQTNAMERELADSGEFAQQRPVNIDPGYVMLPKLVLASCKDRAHRIYLRDGVYAEECLYYVAGWQSRPWTYPDYQRSDFQAFFDQAREYLKTQIRDQA